MKCLRMAALLISGLVWGCAGLGSLNDEADSDEIGFEEDRGGPHIVLKAQQFLPLSLAPRAVDLPSVRPRLRDPQRGVVEGERES